jgi:uncharacterized membrane protein
MTRLMTDKIPVLKYFIVRPRLLVAILLGLLIATVLPDSWRIITKLLVAWDSSVASYLAMAIIMMIRSDNTMIRRRAASQDEGSLIILFLTVFGAIASIAAIIAELVTAKGTSGNAEWQSVALAAVTVILTWVFMQTIFALHYAHEYYNNRKKHGDGGLEFPVKYDTPQYMDFVYFSFIIGTAAQTADINITSTMIRGIVTIHCVVVFFFNTTILALAINIGAGLA